MSFAENLQYLRKCNKITQEELADELGVSRQAVSKWETGEAYPETDKLIILCDKFSVTLDELVRGDIIDGKNTEKPAEKEKEWRISPDEYGYRREMNRFSAAMASGVFLILIGVALCVALSGVAVALEKGSQLSNLLEWLSGVVVLVFVAAAVFLFVFFGMSHDRFKKAHKEVENIFTKEECAAFIRRFTVTMAILVSGILVAVIFLIVMFALLDNNVITGGDFAGCCIVAGFLAVLAFIVGGLVYLGIQHEKYNVAEYNGNTARELNASPRSKLKDAICGSVMMVATAIFLVLGFVFNLWHPAWVVFPVGGIICGIIGALMNAKDDHE